MSLLQRLLNVNHALRWIYRAKHNEPAIRRHSLCKEDARNSLLRAGSWQKPGVIVLFRLGDVVHCINLNPTFIGYICNCYTIVIRDAFGCWHSLLSTPKSATPCRATISSNRTKAQTSESRRPAGKSTLMQQQKKQKRQHATQD